MKKIILSALILICYFSLQAQFPQNPTTGGISIKQTNLGSIEAQRGIKGGQFLDTISANAVPYMKGVGGVQIFTTSDNTYWYRSSDTSHWIPYNNSSSCPGTQLLSGSATWSGSGLVYDVTDLTYYIICGYYSSSATTITLATANPTYGRFDVIYADITGNVGVLTGTAALNPQVPKVNDLTQIAVSIIYIPGSSSVPGGVIQTVIYNENIEWTGTSDVSGINFNYTINPYIGLKSTYIPNAPNNSYVSWQNGSAVRFSDVQYLKFWVRLNDQFVTDPLSFLDIVFKNGSTTVSQPIYLQDGSYNFSYTVIKEWQLVSIPLTGLTVSDSVFDKVYFTIHNAPLDFQMDYIYLLSNAGTPPVISNSWVLTGNSGTNESNNYIGTSDAKRLNFGTNSQTRAYIDTSGIDVISNDDTSQYLLSIKNKKIYQTPFPTIYQGSCIIIYDSSGYRKIKVDPDCVGGGGSQNLFSVTHVGNTTDTSIVVNNGSLFFDGTSNSSFLFCGTPNSASFFTGVGSNAGEDQTGGDFTGIGAFAGSNQTGGGTTVVGMSAGINNNKDNLTAVGVGASSNNSGFLVSAFGQSAGQSNTGDSSIFIGANSGVNNLHRSVINIGVGSQSTSDYQLSFGNYIKSIKATGITGANVSGNVLTTNGSGVFTFQDTISVKQLKSNSLKVDPTGTVTCLGCGLIGVGNSVSSSAGASTAIGEGGTIDENSEATTISNGFGNNAVGCNDCLIGGTTSGGYANGVIAIGNANSGNEESSVTLGGAGNQTNGVASGTYAGQSLTANGLNTVVIGGHDITGDEDNTVYVPSFSITGDKLSITSGTDKSFETVTLSAGKIDVSNATVTADSKIIVTAQSCSNCGFYYISNISAGVGFRINSSNASDASTVSYLKIN